MNRGAPHHPPHDVFSVEPLLARHVQHPVVCLVVVALQCDMSHRCYEPSRTTCRRKPSGRGAPLTADSTSAVPRLFVRASDSRVLRLRNVVRRLHLREHVYAAVALLVDPDDAVDDGHRPVIHVEHHHLAHADTR